MVASMGLAAFEGSELFDEVGWIGAGGGVKVGDTIFIYWFMIAVPLP